MTPSPNDWLALLLLAFMLGLKHGLDADHLVAIDGLTRFNSQHRPRLARWCGTLFSLGHGAVVLAVALAVGTMAARWQVPAWLEDIGAWVSIGFLLVLGGMNLMAVLSASPREMVRTVGVKGRFLGRLQHTRNPLLITLVGSLFALSFDTMSQAALFAVTAAQLGGWVHSLTLGLLFTLGMLLADGCNGFWIARLIRRADETALIASRVFGLVVASLSLLVAGFGMVKYFAPGIDAWSEGRELTFGFAVLAVVAASFLFAVRLSRPRSAYSSAN